jgi:starch synthase
VKILSWSLTFQREVINNIVPRVQPDLIHCNDWMTGLIPAMARKIEIPCLFTIHNIHTVKNTLAQIEDRGIDAAYFWQNFFYERMAYDYETTRATNPVDFLVSGVFAAHFVNTVSPTFLKEIIDGRHDFVEPALHRELSNKWRSDCAFGILNAPDPSFDPQTDEYLHSRYTPQDHPVGKLANKKFLQKKLGLLQNEKAPIFFGPPAWDPIKKDVNCWPIFSTGLYPAIGKTSCRLFPWPTGEYQRIFKEIASFHGFQDRVAVCDFSESLEHLCYGAADFILMPSRFEPCGLPQMIAPIYGSLPVAHDTGGIHDTIRHLDVHANSGNGFLFETYDAQGLFWAIQEAMTFFGQSPETRQGQIQRVMLESARTYNHTETAKKYIALYEKMLKRPLVV